jgi:hypothetical protein
MHSMADDKIFTDGMIVKPPRDGAPDFVKASISIKTEDFVRFLEDHTKPDGWVNIDVKAGQSGKWYGQLNQWTRAAPPSEARPTRRNTDRPEINPDDIPF